MTVWHNGYFPSQIPNVVNTYMACKSLQNTMRNLWENLLPATKGNYTLIITLVKPAMSCPCLRLVSHQCCRAVHKQQPAFLLQGRGPLPPRLHITRSFAPVQATNRELCWIFTVLQNSWKITQSSLAVDCFHMDSFSAWKLNYGRSKRILNIHQRFSF